MTPAVARLFALDGRTAIVTGASRGIGAAIASGLAGAGARVFGLARSALPVEAAAGVDYRACDVTDAAAFAAVCAEAGRVDVLVNAAGITLPAATAAERLANFAPTLDVDLRAVYACCMAAVPRMPRGGSIVNVTSINSVLGFPGNPAYVAAKGGLRMLTRALAVDLGEAGIRANNLAPGYVHTAMTAASHADPALHEQRRRHTILGRWGEPGDMVGAAIFLASDASAYVTGQDLFVDGGWTAKGMV